MLVAARAAQGVGGALLVPGSLSIISATFRQEDRGRAIGMWSGLAGVTTALGPFAGGWLVDVASWRLVFVVNVPLAAVAYALALRLPETKDPDAWPHPDLAGAVTGALGLAGVAYALIEGSVAAGVAGTAALVAFGVVEARRHVPRCCRWSCSPVASSPAPT